MQRAETFRWRPEGSTPSRQRYKSESKALTSGLRPFILRHRLPPSHCWLPKQVMNAPGALTRIEE